MNQSAVRELDIPLSLPDPHFSDDVQPFSPPNFVFLKPRDAVNSNPPRPSRSRGDTVDAPIRIASCIGMLNGLVNAWLLGKRPEYTRIIEGEGQFYDRLCREGADVIFGAGGSIELLQRIKLDLLLCEIPLIVVDSYDYTTFANTRDRFASLGAEAILRLPITLDTVLGAIDQFVPEYKPTDRR
jgi:hypothetical protein